MKKKTFSKSEDRPGLRHKASGERALHGASGNLSPRPKLPKTPACRSRSHVMPMLLGDTQTSQPVWMSVLSSAGQVRLPVSLVWRVSSSRPSSLLKPSLAKNPPWHHTPRAVSRDAQQADPGTREPQLTQGSDRLLAPGSHIGETGRSAASTRSPVAP